MSEKTVNIKITASTKDFSDAIQKAQKRIDDLSDVIDGLGSSKFGEKLEKQLDSLLDALKKAEKQIGNMQDSLGDLGKTKFNKLEDQFKDIIDSGKDVNKKVEEILDLLDKVDKQDLNGLEKEFDRIKDSLENISKETKDSTDTMEKSFRDVADEVDRFIKELNNIEDTKLENLEESVKDMDKYIDEAAESVSDFNKKTDELDTKELNDYIDYLKDVEAISEDVGSVLKKVFGAFSDANGKFNFDLSDKDKGGLMSSLAEGLVSGTIAGKTFENVMEGVADSISDVTKQMKDLDDAVDTKSIDDLGEEYKEAESALEKLTEEYNDLIKKQKECEEAVEKSSKAQQEQLKLEHELADALSKKKKEVAECEAEMAGYKKVVDDWDNAIRQNLKDSTELVNVLERQEKATDDAAHAESEAYNTMMEQRSAVEKLKKEYYDLADAVKQAYDDGEKDKAISIAEAWDKVRKELEEAKKLYKELDKAHEDAGDKWTDEELKLGSLEKQKDALLQQYDALQNQKKAADQASDAYNNLIDKYDKLRKEAKELEDALDDAMDEGTIKSIQEQLDRIDLHHIKKQGQEAAEELEKIKERMAEINKIGQGRANEFNKQYDAYKKLSEEVKEYLENEENGILLREKVAKSFREVANSMESIYKGSGNVDNADLINETLAEAAEHLKELNLVSTENLQADLKRLGEIIEDKTEKIKRFKEINKEWGTEANSNANSLDKRAKDIRNWANSADFAIEAADTLTHAWGDLNAAGESHMKIRERSKYIEDYGKALEENVAHIKNYYHELQTLDEIYKKCTGEQRAIIDDYKQWEKNKDKLLEYNRAINEYMRTLKDTGGQIDSKFLDELGNFDAQKFIDNFEKMGASSVVLSKQINAVKLELLENIKQYKENAEVARENAKQAKENAEAAVEEAKANQKAAKTQEERKEATEKLKKAKEDLINATKKLDNVDNETLEGIKDQIKEYNRLAEAMREIGMAAQDLGKADIAKFNKSLAAMLDNLDTFENDLPKSFEDIKEDIKALFTDMKGFDLDGVWDGLKDIGAGALDMIPDKLKAAASQALILSAALKKCAEWGVDKFTSGLDTVKGALSGLVGIARDVGQEVRDAFENITGMQMDFSSLMEIPVEFESQMAKVGAITGVTGDAFKELEEEARRFGATTRYSATEVAQAMEYMGMAGWDNTQIMAGLKSVLDLATVSGMDLGQASDFVTDGLTALGYEAEDAAKFVDILAAASTSSNTSVAQMQKAFTNCAPVAGTLGITMEDLSLALGLMADKGVKGAKAGTALKNLMANLSAPSEKQLAYIRKFNLEGAQQAIVAGDLAGGLKLFKEALSDPNLTNAQKNAIITTIAGKEALSGVSALLNTTEEDMAELEAAINGCHDAAGEMAANFDNTVKGALLGLASAMQERLLQIFDQTEESIKGVTKQLTEFFNIWNGLSTENGSGLTAAFAYLEGASEGWGQAIADNLEKAMSSIDSFINGGTLDSVLQIGTNIINGIADGIQRAVDNGTLGSAISGAINKIATWFSENLDTVIEVGKEVIDAISKGISENGDVINKVITEIIELQTTIDNTIAYEKWKLIGANLATFIVKGFKGKASELFSGIGGFITGLFTGNDNNNKPDDGNIFDTSKDYQNWTYTDPITGDTYGPGVKNGQNYGDGVKDGVNSKKNDVNNAINSNFADAKVKTDNTASEIGQGISDNIIKKLETMDTGDLADLRKEMDSLGKTVKEVGKAMTTSFADIQGSARTSFMGLTNIVRNQIVNCTNIIRNQFVNMANIVRNQCLNMTNIVRNQSVNWSNIIKNQVTNARNSLTSQFLSMAKVARTQLVNITNIVRNQAVSWANIISNQAKNARDAFTSQMISMAKVASTQMGKVSSSISSSMSQVYSLTGRSMTMSLSVDRTVDTNYMNASNALYAANNASTSSIGNNIGALTYASSAISSGNNVSSSKGMSDNIVIDVPLYLDSKVIARATAKYVDGEIKTMTKRENRKRGVK
jgi:TP901 family phage tail tape measure protein